MHRSRRRLQTPRQSPCTQRKARPISSRGTPAPSPEALAIFRFVVPASPKAAFPKDASPAHLSARRPRYVRRSCANPHERPRATSPPQKDVRQTDSRQYRSMLNKGKPLKEWAATKHRTHPAAPEYKGTRTRTRASPPTPREQQSPRARFRDAHTHRPKIKPTTRCQFRSPLRKACSPTQTNQMRPRGMFPRP